MKTLMLVVSVIGLLFIVSDVNAGMTCRKTALGTTECTTTDGDTITGSRNAFGNTTWSSSRGGTVTCRKTALGTTECD